MNCGRSRERRWKKKNLHDLETTTMICVMKFSYNRETNCYNTGAAALLRIYWREYTQEHRNWCAVLAIANLNPIFQSAAIIHRQIFVLTSSTVFVSDRSRFFSLTTLENWNSFCNWIESTQKLPTNQLLKFVWAKFANWFANSPVFSSGIAVNNSKISNTDEITRNNFLHLMSDM